MVNIWLTWLMLTVVSLSGSSDLGACTVKRGLLQVRGILSHSGTLLLQTHLLGLLKRGDLRDLRDPTTFTGEGRNDSLSSEKSGPLGRFWS